MMVSTFSPAGASPRCNRLDSMSYRPPSRGQLQQIIYIGIFKVLAETGRKFVCVVLNCSGSLVETMYEGGEVWFDCSNGRRELAIFLSESENIHGSSVIVDP